MKITQIRGNRGACGAGDNVLDSIEPERCVNRTTIFADDFESGAAGWTVSNTSPPTPYDWELTVNPLPYSVPGVAYFCADADVGDCGSQDESAVHSLMSPVMTVPVDAEHVRVSFMYDYYPKEAGDMYWRFVRGAWMGQLFNSDVRRWQTRLNVAAFPDSNGGVMVRCVLDLEMSLSKPNSKQRRQLADELDDLERILTGNPSGVGMAAAAMQGVYS